MPALAGAPVLVCGEGAAHAIGQGRGAILILPNLRRLGRDRALPLRWVRPRAGLGPCPTSWLGEGRAEAL